MKTTLSKNGRLTIPLRILKQMNLRPGDPIEVRIEGERIVLVPKQKRAKAARIIKDPLTGLPVLTVGKNAPQLTSEEVARILADFP